MKIIKKGFSLIEMLLVLGIMLTIAMFKAQSIQQGDMDYIAKTLASEISTVSNATNAYLVLNYSNISKLSIDNGTCDNNGYCSLSISLLKSQNLLPPNFSDSTILNQPYEIQIKRTGSSPNYMISGLVLTDGKNSKTNQYNPIILGNTVRNLGSDGGVNKKDGSIYGLMGKWSATSSDFPILSGKSNYVGAIVGSLSGAYYVYLRRDGTLPMTGDLDMGGNSIANANQISAKGDINTTSNISASGNITSGGQIIAHNGYGDSINLGGDNGGNDYELRLNSPKQLTIYSPNASTYTTVLEVNHNVKIDQRLGLMGTNPNILPSGWGGGLTTLDVYANGTVGAGSGGSLNSYLTSGGDIYASNRITAGSELASNGNIHAGQNIYATGSINSSGDVNVGKRLNAYEYVYVNGIAVSGSSCDKNGLQGRDSTGKLLSCVNGKWQNLGVSTWQTCRSCGGKWPYTIAQFTLHGDSGVIFNGYTWGCGGSYTYGVSNDGDYVNVCSSTNPAGQ